MTEHVPQRTLVVNHPTNGLSLAAMTRAAMATTSIASHEARIAHMAQPTMMDDPRMHMTIDELRALPGGHLDGDAEPVFDPLVDGDGTGNVTGLLAPSHGNAAKRARRAARMGDVPVVINRRAPDPVPAKPKRKSRAKKTAA